MATQAELTQQIATLTTQVSKIGTETASLLTQVTDLQAIIANGPAVSPELQAAVDALAARIRVVDELVPDAPVPTPA